MSAAPESGKGAANAELSRWLMEVRERFAEAWRAAARGAAPPGDGRGIANPEAGESASWVLADSGENPGRAGSAPLDATVAYLGTYSSGAKIEETLADSMRRGPGTHTALGETLADMTPRAGREQAGSLERPQIPGYQILDELGRGGMGVVYKARHIVLERLVALKVVIGGAHAGPEQRARFLTEAQAVAHLLHPGIVQIFDVGETNGLPFISLEFVDGQSLDKLIAGKPQEPARAAELVEFLARAMYVSHQANVVHRDLKPANVLLTRQGVPKITDFGLAKRLETDSGQTRSGSIMGTPGYMAPEQAMGRVQEIGPRSDLYSLGAILYELLTGRPPFQGATLLETLEQVRTQEPVAPTRLVPKIPRDIETICLKCLQKEPNKRYTSTQALAEDLRRFLNGEPIQARPVSMPEQALRWCRRNPRIAGLASVAASLLVLLLYLWGYFTIHLREEKFATEKQRDAARIAQAQADANARTALRREQQAKTAEARADANAGIAKKNADTAAKNAKLASDQMRLALDALKTLVTGVQTELRDRPGMQGLRQNLITVATAKLDEVAKKAEGFNLSEQGSAADPDVELYLRALAGAHQRMADIYMEAGQSEKAFEYYKRAHDIVEKVAHDKPGDPIALRNLAAVKNNLGDFHRDQLGDMKGASELYHKALDLRLQWAKLQPEDDGAKQAVSNSYGLVGGVLLRLGDPGAALPEYLESKRWRETISPPYANGVVEVQREWAGTYDRLGEISLKLRHADQARTYYETALEIRQRLIGDDVDTISAMSDLAISCENLGDVVLLLQNDPTAARDFYARACGYIERFWKRDPANIQVQLMLAHAYYKLATAYQQGHEKTLADEYFGKALERLLAVSPSGQPGVNRNIDLMLALAQRGRHGEAAELAKSLAEAGDQNAQTLFQVACAYAICARVVPQPAAATTPAPSEELARSYANQAIEALRRCVALGWKDAVSLELDPDLGAIRKESAFRQLVEQIQAAQAAAGSASSRAEPVR